jgi:hypothetical protein
MQVGSLGCGDFFTDNGNFLPGLVFVIIMRRIHEGVVTLDARAI